MKCTVESPRAELLVRNRQKVRPIRLSLVRRMAKSILSESIRSPGYQLGVSFVTATRMAALNQGFLGHAGSTDVITFDYKEPGAGEAIHGEIFICVQDAIEQAARFKTTWQSETVRYLIHGILHLAGYDDLEPGLRRTMKRREGAILKRLAAKFPVDTLDYE
jgi:rRNA maturation RNase YbeY